MTTRQNAQVLREKTAKNEVGVGNSERAALAVTGWAGVGSGGLDRSVLDNERKLTSGPTTNMPWR